MWASPIVVRLGAVPRVEAIGADHPARVYFRNRHDAEQAHMETLAAGRVDGAAATVRQIGATMLGIEVHWLATDCAFDLVPRGMLRPERAPTGGGTGHRGSMRGSVSLAAPPLPGVLHFVRSCA